MSSASWERCSNSSGAEEAGAAAAGRGDGTQDRLLAEGSSAIPRPDRRRPLARRDRSHGEPPAPIRAADITNIGDRRAAKLRRPRHAPSRHNKLPLAVGSIANDRSHLVGEDPRKQRQVARSIIPRAKPIADRGLAFDQTVEIAHRKRSVVEINCPLRAAASPFLAASLAAACAQGQGGKPLTRKEAEAIMM
jgi:hypothetical protein